MNRSVLSVAIVSLSLIAGCGMSRVASNDCTDVPMQEEIRAKGLASAKGTVTFRFEGKEHVVAITEANGPEAGGDNCIVKPSALVERSPSAGVPVGFELSCTVTFAKATGDYGHADLAITAASRYAATGDAPWTATARLGYISDGNCRTEGAPTVAATVLARTGVVVVPDAPAGEGARPITTSDFVRTYQLRTTLEAARLAAAKGESGDGTSTSCTMPVTADVDLQITHEAVQLENVASAGVCNEG